MNLPVFRPISSPALVPMITSVFCFGTNLITEICTTVTRGNIQNTVVVKSKMKMFPLKYGQIQSVIGGVHRGRTDLRRFQNSYKNYTPAISCCNAIIAIAKTHSAKRDTSNCIICAGDSMVNLQ